MNRLMMAVVEDSEDEAMVEALAVVETLAMAMDRLFVITVDPQDIMLGIVRTLLRDVNIASPMIIL